jgi:hypothetical protein
MGMGAVTLRVSLGSEQRVREVACRAERRSASRPLLLRVLGAVDDVVLTLSDHGCDIARSPFRDWDGEPM